MALWLVRAGKYGEHEERFFSSDRVYLTWDGIESFDLRQEGTWEGIKQQVTKAYPQKGSRWHSHTTGQFWAFILGVTRGDWAAPPRKTKSAVAIGEERGKYEYAPPPRGIYRHSRKVRWLNQ